MQTRLLMEVGGVHFLRTSIPFYVGSACVRENLKVGGSISHYVQYNLVG